MPSRPPVHLARTDENVEEIATLASMLGGAAGLEDLLDDLKYQARRTRLPRALGRAVSHAYAFDAYDEKDESWWPQGISTSADASDPEVVGGDRDVLVVAWYSKRAMGSRVTFLDLATLKYRHVLLVEPVLDQEGRLRLEPVRIHAGGIVWCGPWLHVAATAKGFVTFRVDDIMRVAHDNDVPERLGVLDDGRIASYGHHFVLPVRFRYRAYAEQRSQELRYSFLSLDRGSDPPALLAGEYGRGRRSTRLARYALDPATGLLATGQDGLSWPTEIDESGVSQMQGAVAVRGDYLVSVSHGPWTPGSVYVGRPGSLREHRRATPMGPEDLTYWPETDTLWSVTEHPRRRWIFAMERSWFARPHGWQRLRAMRWRRAGRRRGQPRG